MSITDFQLIRVGHNCKLAWNAPSEITDIYQLISNIQDENPLVVGTYNQLPALGATYFRGTSGATTLSQTLILIGKHPYQPDPECTTKWRVDCTYSDAWLYNRSGKGKTRSGQASDNPYDWRDEIEIGFAQHKKIADDMLPVNSNGQIDPNAKAGVPKNSAGQPFDPRIENDDDRMVLRITQYRQGNPQVEGYKGAINSDAVTISKPYLNFTRTYPPLTLKMANIAIHSELHNGLAYWRVTWELHVNLDTWDLQVADMGFPKIVAGQPNGRGGTWSQTDAQTPPGIYHPIVNGNVVTVPLPLDGQGNLLALDQPTNYLRFRRKNFQPFSSLAL